MEQIKSNEFGMTWGRVNDDRVFIIVWTIPLKIVYIALLSN